MGEHKGIFMINYEFCKLQLEHLKKGEVLIHTSAVCKNGKSIIFCGPTESGKTRYMIEFCKRGWKCLGDDFVLIKEGFIYSYFLEPCHMKYYEGKIPFRKIPLNYIYKIIRKLTKRRPYIFLTPKELGITTAFKTKLDRIVFLKGCEGNNIEEKVYNNTRTKGGFDEFENGNYNLLLEEIIRENVNEDTLIETTIDLARQL